MPGDCEALEIMQKLKVDANFVPCPVLGGDEFFANGIFEFNISRILEHLESHASDADIEEISVADFDHEFSVINESHVETVDFARPVVFAEISPGRFNLIDGHHRMEKARRHGAKTVRAYKLTASQHITFLTSKNAYLTYIEYWNDKVKQVRKREAKQKPRAITRK